ncbi:MAG: hypothetical protein ACYCTF_03100 [Acidiferrobacter sp.]
MPYIPQVDERISSQFLYGLVTPGLTGCFSVNKAFGFRLPFAEEFLHATVVVDGKLQKGGLLWQNHAMDELTL